MASVFLLSACTSTRLETVYSLVTDSDQNKAVEAAVASPFPRDRLWLSLSGRSLLLAQGYLDPTDTRVFYSADLEVLRIRNGMLWAASGLPEGSFETLALQSGAAPNALVRQRRLLSQFESSVADDLIAEVVEGPPPGWSLPRQPHHWLLLRSSRGRQHDVWLASQQPLDSTRPAIELLSQTGIAGASCISNKVCLQWQLIPAQTALRP